MRRRPNPLFGSDWLIGGRRFLLAADRVLLHVEAVWPAANHELAGLVDDFRLDVVDSAPNLVDRKARSNPYLAFAAMMMAGLDGILNKTHPGDALDKDLYDLPPEEEKELKLVAFSLDEALGALDEDREFLRAGDVFSDDLIDAYIDLKLENVTRLRMTTHPVEFDMYYSL